MIPEELCKRAAEAALRLGRLNKEQMSLISIQNSKYSQGVCRLYDCECNELAAVTDGQINKYSTLLSGIKQSSENGSGIGEPYSKLPRNINNKQIVSKNTIKRIVLCGFLTIVSVGSGAYIGSVTYQGLSRTYSPSFYNPYDPLVANMRDSCFRIHGSTPEGIQKCNNEEVQRIKTNENENKKVEKEIWELTYGNGFRFSFICSAFVWIYVFLLHEKLAPIILRFLKFMTTN